MTTTPYTNHADAYAQIDSTIRNETLADSVSTDDVSDADQRALNMVDAIVRTTSAGAITYHAPDDRTIAGAWYALLKTVLEAASNGDRFTLPCVLFKPSDANSQTITMTATDVSIYGNGAVLEYGLATPAGLILNIPASTLVQSLVVRVAADTEYCWAGQDMISVKGKDTATTDVVALEAALEALEANGQGTLLIDGTFLLDTTYSANATAIIITRPINIVGTGPSNTFLRFVGLGLYYTSDSVFDFVTGSATAGAPSNPTQPNQSIFNATAHGLVAGDWVFIWSQDLNDAIQGANDQLGYLHHPCELVEVVESISADQFRVAPNVRDPMTTCFIAKATMNGGFIIRDFSISQNDSSRQRTTIQQSHDFVVDNVHFKSGPDPTTEGHSSGFYIKNCYRFAMNNITAHHATTVGLTEGYCIILVGPCTYGEIRNVATGTMRHHFDTGAIYKTDIDDQQGGTMNTGFGTVRDVLIDGWQARHNTQIPGSEARAIINTHENGHSLNFTNIALQMHGPEYGFGIRSRHNTFKDCRVYGQGATSGYGYQLRGVGNIVDGCLAEECFTGVTVQDNGACKIVNSVFRNCSVGVSMLAGANYTAIQGNVFDNQTGNFFSAGGANTHILFYDETLVGMRVIGNDLRRGINQSAIHIPSYSVSRVSAIHGNSIDGWNERSDTTSEAFYEGTLGNHAVYTPSIQLSSKWKSHNYQESLSQAPSQDTLNKGHGVIANSTDYSNADWRIFATVNIRDGSNTGVIFSRKAPGTATNWLGATSAGNRWYTRVHNGTYYFETLPLWEENGIYEIVMEQIASSNSITLTINGQSENTTLTQVSCTGDISIGNSIDDVFVWRGDCGVVFESPFDNEVFRWPT